MKTKISELALPDPKDAARLEGFPDIGKWMIASDHRPARWVGRKHDGKALAEPINVILVDHRPGSAVETRKCVYQACRQAGYKVRWGHTSGYKACLGGDVYEQLPEGFAKAFGTTPCLLVNNHGRLFGPCFRNGRAYFIGAFSREKFSPLNLRSMHRFTSYNRARDDLARKMDAKTGFKQAGFVALGNCIIDAPDVSTGDHDGMAVLLERA